MFLPWEGNTARTGTKSCCSGSAGAVHAQHMYFGLPCILIPDAEAMLLDIYLLFLFCLARLNSEKFAT